MISFDYHIAVYFDRPSTDHTHNKIFTIATTRLAYIYICIELGMIMVELIYIPCKEVEKNKKINF